MLTRRHLLSIAAAAAAMPDRAQTAEGITARTSGYRMPLESDPHERTFMQWPVVAGIYGGHAALEEVQASIAGIARAILRFEPVVMLAGGRHHATARAALGDGIELWDVETEDLWCRDSGPTFVVDGKGGLAASELNFNGWGNKQSHKADGKIARKVAARMGLTVFDNPIVGEGGGVETDGAGTLLAHASCWVNANRNKADKAQVERWLLDALGAEAMIWAPGIKGADITDYHIDALARFVRPGLVLIQLGDTVDRSDPWSVAAFETFEILKAARDAGGRKLEIVVVPNPDYDRIRSRSEEFVSSYVNYYVANGAVIGEEFGDDRADAEAARILGQLYPGREIVSLNVDPVGEAGGGIHCATQQQPKV
jgi:agmatine deiminase